MNAKGLAHLGKRTQDKIIRYTEEVKEISGDNLVSIILYGNATLESFDVKLSSINFLIILREITVDFLTAYARMRKRFRNVAAPLLFTPELIKTSLDIFPIEFLSLKESYIVLYGEDVLKDIDVRIEDLRNEIEQQIKRRLIKIREEFIYSIERKADLERLLISSLISFIPVFRNILRLIKKESPVEGTLFMEFCKEMGLDGSPFFDIWAVKTGEVKYSKDRLIRLFGDFMKEIEILAARLENVIPKGRDSKAGDQ